MNCSKCGDDGHVFEVCTLRIQIPNHVKTHWTCPNCDQYFESLTPSMNHEYVCASLSVSSGDQTCSRPQKRQHTLPASPKKCPPFYSKPPLVPRDLRTSTYLSLF